MYHRLLVATAIAFAGCHSSQSITTAPSLTIDAAAPVASPHHGASLQKAGPLPLGELQRAKLASARYNSVKNAIRDGYVDINVVLPNMGRHFRKQSLVDANFEVERPELLVYREGPNGHLNLVAVEYAVPLELSSSAPEGFQGTADDWFPSQDFHLWLLHAWVWQDNPDGVFNPTNSTVP